MTVSDMINELRAMTESDEADTVLLTYLDAAGNVILNRMYPFLDNDTDYSEMEVPARFHNKLIRIAAFLMNKRGAEGETIHSENGINRHWKDADVPTEMLFDIVPQIGIPG